MEDIKTWLVPLLEEKGCSLYGLEWDRKTNPPILRIMIDRDDEPVDLDLCTTISDLVSQKLDEIDKSDDQYVLEVCSAGIDKPIDLDQAQKAVGSYVCADLKEMVDGAHFLEGTLENADEDSIVLSYFIKGRPKKRTIQKEAIRQLRHSVKV